LDVILQEHNLLVYICVCGLIISAFMSLCWWVWFDKTSFH